MSFYNQENFGYGSSDALVFDRKLVEPGDTLHLAGFLVSREDSLEIRPYGQNPKDEPISVRISPSFDPSAQGFEIEEFPVEVDPDYGTFQLEIEIPPDAPRREYSIGVPFFTSFTVGEPRVLTATVSIEAPVWVQPNATFEATVTIASLLGVPIADAEFTLIWRSRREGTIGSVDLMTDATGVATTAIDLAESELPVVPGDTIELEVRYIGPTREPIFSSRSVDVATTSLILTVDASIPDPVPGLTEFGASVNVQSRDDNDADNVYDVTVELLELEDALSADVFRDRLARLTFREDDGIVLDVVRRCKLNSNDSLLDMYRTCRFVLPDVGHYALRGCVELESSFACGADTLGRNVTEWEADPLSRFPFMSLEPQTLSIVRNGEASMFIEVPYPEARGILIWGDDLESQYKTVYFREPGLQVISFQPGRECLNGCRAKLALSAPRREIDLEIDIPTEFDFDLGLPFEGEPSEVVVSIEDDEVPFTLDVQIESEASVVTPGSNTTIQLSVQKCPGNPNLVDPGSCDALVPARDVEVVVIGVDKAYLELESNPLTDLVRLLDPLIFPSYFNGVLGNDWHSIGFFEKTLALMLQVNDIDPWRLSDMIFTDGSGFQQLGFVFSQILDNYRRSEALTLPPPELSRILAWFGRELQQAPDPRPMPSGRSPDSVEEEDDPDLRRQTDFEVTPLFTVIKTDNEGRADVTFEAPDNVGTFVLRAYASSLDAQHGSTEIEVINRLPLTLTPSAPRFVRIGDEFEAGVIVTLSTEEREGVKVTVTLLGDPAEARNIVFLGDDVTEGAFGEEEECDGDEELSCLVVLQEQEFESDVDGQVEVRFRFAAVRLGDANITIRADALGESDALQVTLPVLAQQNPVVLGTSFSINPENDPVTSEEGLQFPDAVPGSGSLNLIAGVGKFPTVLEIAQRFLDSTDRPIVAIEALANITLPFIFQGYGVDASPENRQLYRRALTAFEMGLANVNLRNLTNRNRGLQWFIPASPLFRPSRVDVRLNAFALRIVNALIDGLETETRVLRNGVRRLGSLTEIWRERLIAQVIDDTEDQVDQGSEPSSFIILTVLQALGSEWRMRTCPSRAACTSPAVAETFTLERVIQAFNEDRLGTREQIMLASLLLEEEARAALERPEVQSIVDGLFDRIRTIGRTAYVAESFDTSTPASREDVTGDLT